MIVKNAVSLISGLGETALSSGMNTCKKAINKLGKLMVYKTAGERFENMLKSALKPYELLKKENIMKLKEKLLLKNGMGKDSDSICCPNCGLALPQYYIFCICCGTQLFDDIFYSNSNKSINAFQKSIFNLLDFSTLLNNLKLLRFLYKRLDKCLLSLTGLDNRV